MSIVINTNVSSLVAQNSLSQTGRGLDVSLERLASGLRINSSKDDAAGLAIANRLSAQIGGLRVAVRNANDGISLSQTAEGALQETTNILLRIRDLSVQSINDSNDSTDRANIQKEVAQLTSEVNRIATSTKFSGQNLLDSSFTNKVFQVGAFANEDISISISGARAADLGSNTAVSDQNIGPKVGSAAAVATNNYTAQTLTITPSANGSVMSVAIAAADTAKTIAININKQTPVTGVSATAETQLTLGAFSIAGGQNITSVVTFTLSGNSSSVLTATNFSTTDLTTVLSAINNASSGTGVTAAFEDTTDKSTITLTSSDGYDITLKNFGQTSLQPSATLSYNATSGGVTAGLSESVTSTISPSSSIRVSGKVTFSSSDAFSIAAHTTGGGVVNTSFISVSNLSSTASTLANVDVSTQTGARDAIAIIDSGLSKIDDLRATLGAIQNRLVNTINNLTNVANNQEAARSRIVDADFAEETATLTKNQILQQAGISILAQANARPQAVLTLLKYALN